MAEKYIAILQIGKCTLLKEIKNLRSKEETYYSGSRTWTTHYDRRKMYKTYDEANKENEQFLRDILYIHKDGRGSILSDDK